MTATVTRIGPTPALEYVNGHWQEVEPKRMNSIGDCKQLASALAKAQAVVENAKKLNKNPHFKSNYADLATVWDTIREPLTANGLSVVQLPCDAPAGQVGLVTHILHSSGESITERYFLGLKDATNPQQVGSALTYMKRYALLGVAGIAPEDDDGNAATGRPAGPPVDYEASKREVLDQLAKATDTEARQLYADVRNSVMPQPHKNELLSQMADVIKERQTKATAPKTTKGTK